ncbi:hypothetical protein CKO44_25515, partial [Rubrivivax gelatinosus]|uniref:hypothetical protein n=1 Tax=Rubrivivax gelatinosus TaxID=28068 RepID=UPI001905D2B1
DTVKHVDRITHKSVFAWADERDPTWRDRAAASWVDADVVVDLGAAPEAAPAEPVPDATPRPLAAFPAPFRGVLAATVAAGLNVAPKPQPELMTLAVLAGMAAACTRRLRLPGDGRLNLYAVGLAETGAGKDAPRRVGVDLARLAGAALLGKPASGQGLEDALQSDRAMLCEVDEVAHMLAAVNDRGAPGHMKELGGNLLKLFSASNSVYPCRVRAKASDSAPPPRVVLNPKRLRQGFS